MLTADDRVFCDCCGAYIGQLWHRVLGSAPAIPDRTRAPHFALCPDCCDRFARPARPAARPSLLPEAFR